MTDTSSYKSKSEPDEVKQSAKASELGDRCALVRRSDLDQHLEGARFGGPRERRFAAREREARGD